MNRTTTTSRLTFLRAGAVALPLVFAAILASAGSPRGAPASADPLAVEPALLVETLDIDVAAIPESCLVEAAADAELFTAAPGDDVSTAFDVDTSNLAPASQAARPMRGYCRCTCSLIPNCTTNADCGGGLCLKGPTCC